MDYLEGLVESEGKSDNALPMRRIGDMNGELILRAVGKALALSVAEYRMAFG